MSEPIFPKKVKLSNGYEIPTMGMGTHRIKNAANVIYSSIKDGVRLIDTATRYGNEEDVGKGIKRALDEGICKREELFVTTKIWPNDKVDPEKALKESLQRLQLDYIDLYLDHWPATKDYRENPEDKIEIVSNYEFWPKMESLVDKGLARSIGLSNYNVQNMLNILSFCRIKPVALQAEFHLYFYQKNLKDFCDKENITFISYFPLGHGNNARIYIKEHDGEFDIFEEKIIKDLAKKYEKTVGEIILNWHLRQGVIPIPATSKEWRMRENLDTFNFRLEDEDFEKLNNAFDLKRIRFCGSKKYFKINIFS